MADLASSKAFWESKARENAHWYISSYGPYSDRDESLFWASGSAIWEEIKRETGYRPAQTDTVVEVGCGVGRLTRALAAEVGRCHAFDISAEMLARARAAVPCNVALHLAGGRSLHPVQDNAVDLVLAYCVFQHLPGEDVLSANLAEMVRVAKPGALLAFTTSPRDWKALLLPLSRVKGALLAPFTAGAPQGTYKKEWVGIRPSRRRVQRLCPLPMQFRSLPNGRWLYWGRKPVTAA
ncbi:MAG: class I SAM-dependent methyltransferase [Terriglobales bacterium]